MLLKVFKGKNFLCLVSLNPENPQHWLVDWDELKKRVRHKRSRSIWRGEGRFNIRRVHSPGARPAKSAQAEKIGAAREPRISFCTLTPGSRPGLQYGVR